MEMRTFNLEAVGQSFDVCAIGNAIVDIIANGDDEFLETHGIHKNVMNLIDADRADFLYQRIGPGVETSGGSAANTAAGIASLGGMPVYIGKVKDDAWGKVFRHDLHALGVSFTTSPAADGPSTARSLIVVTPDAQRSMSTYLGACVDLSPADIDPAVIQAAQITYLEGYLFDKPTAQQAFREAAKIAHAADRQLALALSDPFCVERHRADFLDLVKTEVDLLIGNEEEYMSLFQTNTFEAAIDAAKGFCRMIVGTRGAKGAVVNYGGAGALAISAEVVDPVIDTTGAGDLFASGLLFGMTHGMDLPQSTRLGAISAAEVISHYGPRPLCSLKEYVENKGIHL
jgi:sugar/nucleoside kinase (ribokinase family)